MSVLPAWIEMQLRWRRGEARKFVAFGWFTAVMSGYSLSAGECGGKDQVSCTQSSTIFRRVKAVLKEFTQGV